MIAGDELALFEASLRRATETTTGDALDAALDDIGWRDALDADRRAAVSLFFELQGRAGATSSALDVVIAVGLGAAPVVLPMLGRVDAPGRRVEAGVDVKGIVTASIGRVDEFVVVLAGRDQIARIPSDELEVRPVAGLDPALGLAEVSGAGVGAVVDATPWPTVWADAVAVAQLALAHELVGASRAMLALARDHAVERIQFGQPIAQFQAVRHRLADTYVAIESAAAAVDAAWEDGSTLAAAVAKAVAGRNARLAARHCQQVLAGIGFTAEHPFHGYLRRVLVLERLFGDARSLTLAVGEELLRTRQVPPLLAL